MGPLIAEIERLERENADLARIVDELRDPPVPKHVEDMIRGMLGEKPRPADETAAAPGFACMGCDEYTVPTDMTYCRACADYHKELGAR